MNSKTWDSFLDDATWSVRDAWEDASKQKLTDTEMDMLNDLLSEFFSDRHGSAA